MGLYPGTREGQYNLQPGARGEMFQADMPGYRNQGDRINRTNMNLSVSLHDVPNVTYSLDQRLPVLFRYGFAHGFNQLTLPKGRIASVDADMNMIDYDTKKANNVLTLANGGNSVFLNGKEWQTTAPTRQLTKSGESLYYSTGNADGVGVDAATGKATTTATTEGAKPVVRDDVRLANTPLGIIQRNEYTRDNNALNGMAPGPVLTDALVELPLFELAADAKANPWGSAVGNLKPGDLVKSDENGRFVVSPLSRLDEATLTDIKAVERERQQVVGQVLEVKRDLVPMGAAKYASWSMSDKMSFEPFNPKMWAENGRRGEDIVGSTPWGLQDQFGGTVSTDKNMTGLDPFEPAGYPYDSTMTDHDLHMMASSVRNSDLRMPMEHKLEMGIPGLTDGGNVAIKEIGPENLGEISTSENKFVPMSYKTSEVDIAVAYNESGAKTMGIELLVTAKTAKEVAADLALETPALEWTLIDNGTLVPVDAEASMSLKVQYAKELQGFVVLEEGAGFSDVATASAKKFNVFARYKKRGLAGVPTLLDWQGVVGTVSILLQK